MLPSRLLRWGEHRTVDIENIDKAGNGIVRIDRRHVALSFLRRR